MGFNPPKRFAGRNKKGSNPNVCDLLKDRRRRRAFALPQFAYVPTHPIRIAHVQLAGEPRILHRRACSQVRSDRHFPRSGLRLLHGFVPGTAQSLQTFSSAARKPPPLGFGTFYMPLRLLAASASDTPYCGAATSSAASSPSRPCRICRIALHSGGKSSRTVRKTTAASTPK
jgi:hypothetical protein